MLVLDSRIRDWVLIPVVVVMFLFGILRHYVMVMLRPSSKTAVQAVLSRVAQQQEESSENRATRLMDPVPVNDTVRRSQLLTRARLLRENGHHLPRHAFERRRHEMCNERNGLLREEIPSAGSGALALSNMADPTKMVDMMKGNFATIIPNIVMLGWVSYFFAGFVIAKFPFPLTGRFRGMVQRGVDNIQDLDVTYVTSASMYFLILFGLRGLLSLILGENAADDAQLMQQQQQQMMAMGGGAGPDMSKLFAQERENLELVKHGDQGFKQDDDDDEMKGLDLEDRLLKRWNAMEQ